MDQYKLMLISKEQRNRIRALQQKLYLDFDALMDEANSNRDKGIVAWEVFSKKFRKLSSSHNNAVGAIIREKNSAGNRQSGNSQPARSA